MSDPTPAAVAGLSQLGAPTPLPANPEAAVLERVANPHPGRAYVVRFTCPEFTSLCPITGQPDFAHIVLEYIPEAWIVESKSLKLFLGAFRNHGAFHEDCTLSIAGRVADVGSRIIAEREAARQRHGWIMDTYLLRRAGDRQAGTAGQAEGTG